MGCGKHENQAYVVPSHICIWDLQEYTKLLNLLFGGMFKYDDNVCHNGNIFNINIT